MAQDDDQIAATAAESGPNKLEFHYIKSNLFRVVHADGAIGSITPRGYIHVAFYNERRAIPRRTEITVDSAAEGLPEEVTETRGGVVREVEVDVLLDERTTAELIEWLTGKLETLRRIMRDAAEMDQKAKP